MALKPAQEPIASPNAEPSALLNIEPSAPAIKEPSAAPELKAVVSEEPSEAYIEEPSASPIKEHPSASPIEDRVSLQKFNPNNWIEIRKQLSIGASLGEIASHCLYKGREGSQLNFLIDSDETSLYDSAHQQSLAEALTDYFQQPVTVDITFGVAEQETPRAANIRETSERLALAIDTLNSDPEVIKFKAVFDGALDEKSVRPID